MAIERKSFPWKRPRFELVLLVLVAFVALSPVYPENAQDDSRICLANAIVHGRLSADNCLSDAFDRASYGGHLYSDKAPGLSVLEIPGAEVARMGDTPARWSSLGLRLWVVRTLSVGLLFLLCALVVGRVSEGLAPGYGAPALVAFALGTLVEPLANASFEHVPSALLCLGAFLLAWRRRPFLAGLTVGAAVLVDYEAGLVAVIVAVYLVAQGWRPLARYAVGGLPSAALLAAYDRAAFGAPWHLSYDHVDNIYATEQATGVFGIGTPHVFQNVEIFAGPGGLLVISPVVVLAAWGLWLLRREYPAEAAVCAAVTVAFVLVNGSYFLPYGGLSPGPRFLIPSLPFLALGLGPAFRRAPRTTAAAAIVSVFSTTAVMLVWASNRPLRGTVWGELARVPGKLGSSRYVRILSENATHELHLSRVWGAGLVALAAAAALTVGLRSISWREARPLRLPRSSAANRVAVIGAIWLLAAADACAVMGYPYGNRTAGRAIDIANIDTTIWADTTKVSPGGDVNFDITVTYKGNTIAKQLLLTIDLSAGMHLEGPPAYTIGSGCTGTTKIVCNLDYLPALHSTTIRLGTQITQPSRQTISAKTTTKGIPGYNHPKLSIDVAS